MKAELRLAIVLLVPSMLTGLVACSSPPETKNNVACADKSESGDCQEEVTAKKKTRATEGQTATAPAPAPAPAPTTAPTAPPADAQTKDGIKNGDETDVDCGGAKAPGCADGKTCSVAKDCKNNICTAGKCAAPAVQTNYCQQLGPCCSTLSSTVEKLACMGVQFAGKEVACQAELVVCGIGGISGTPCGNLNKCCDQMQAEGYTDDAADCRSHNTGNASTCDSWLSQYQGMQWCN